MIGNTISHFEILDKLGEGGMGVVYKARDKRLERLVAIKVLSAKAVSNRERELRFVQEAKSASALNHPNIITVHEIDTTGEIAFIAMEYVDGRTLEQLIPRRGMQLAEALNYAVQIADALAAAHAAGIIHRDIKPANIMVTENGLVKVLDFGLAKLTDQGTLETAATVSMRSPETEEGTILGTVAYLSPEQAEGKKIDGRSDIFSFGATLYEMLTGRRAFLGDTKLSTLAAIVNREPKPASEIVENFPRDLDRILVRCLRKDRARRFQSMADLKVALDELKQESEVGQLTQTTIAPVRRKMSAGPILVLAVVALAAAGLTWFLLRPAAKPEAAARLIPLTAYPGSERSPSFSPDGSQVAFSWNGEKQDNYDIYVKMVDSGSAPLRLTTNPEPDVSPAWSPNGRYIAFLRNRGVYLISPLGGPERKLCELHSTRRPTPDYLPTSGLSWTPDSKSLAVQDRLATTDPARIFLISVDTGESRPLTEPT
jgi:eukaryotic-like serine/threonine-protein kinase